MVIGTCTPADILWHAQPGANALRYLRPAMV
jgi:hypothetical protein